MSYLGLSYLRQTFRYLSISISFARHIDFEPPLILCATCLLCLNWMWVPLQSVRLQCFNVSTQICCPDHPCQFFLLARTAHRPIVHIWICSQIIAGFVPRPSAHLFPISCGLGSNWEGGFVEQEPHICCPAASIFLHPSARPSGPLLNGCKAHL